MANKEQNGIVDAEYIQIPLSKLEPNKGQIDGLPANPRLITDAKMEKLKENIQKYPEMLKLRGLLVYPFGEKYVIIGGNMRYEAMSQLGFTDAPCMVIPIGTTAEQMQAYTILDNNGFGKWDWEIIANDWDQSMIEDWGVDLPISNTEINLDEFFTKEEEAKEKSMAITVTIPKDLEECKSDIVKVIEDALEEDYQGCKVK